MGCFSLCFLNKNIYIYIFVYIVTVLTDEQRALFQSEGFQGM